MKTPTPKVRAQQTPEAPTPPAKATRADDGALQRAIAADEAMRRQEENEKREARIRPGLMVCDRGLDQAGVVLSRQGNNQLLILSLDGHVYSTDVSAVNGVEDSAPPGSPLDLIADGVAKLLAPHAQRIIGGQQAAPKDGPFRAKMATAMDAIGAAASAIADAQEAEPDRYSDEGELNKVWEALANQYRAMGALLTDNLMSNTDGDCVVDQAASGVLGGVRPMRQKTDDAMNLDLLAMLREVDVMGWRMQEIIKTKKALLEGQVHVVEDEVLLYQIEETLDKAKGGLSELISHCVMIRNFERQKRRSEELNGTISGHHGDAAGT